MQPANRNRKPGANAQANARLTAGLGQVLADNGFELLSDDGVSVWVDDYTDSYKIHFRPAGWRDKWKHNGDPAVWKPSGENT